MEKVLNVLHVCYSDNLGGASKAALRIHDALYNSEDIASTVLVVRRYLSRSDVITPNRFDVFKLRLYGKITKLALKLQFGRKESLRSLNIIGNDLVKYILENNPDVVHFHWIGNESMSLKSLKKIPHIAKIFTLHDMWLFCGAEHYLEFDEKKRTDFFHHSFETGYKYRYLRVIDWDWIVFKVKSLVFKEIKFSVSAPSRWMYNQARKSLLLKEKKIEEIGNPVNLDVYRKLSVKDSFYRKDLKGKVVLFGALNSTSDDRKGFNVLLEALKYLEEIYCEDEITLLVFGDSKAEINLNLSFDSVFLGHISDEDVLASIYNRADVMVVPSLLEAFGQTVCESMACGTPVVGFRNTGVESIIDHGINGFLAEHGEANSLADGIRFILDNKNYDSLSLKAVQAIENKFSYENIAKKFIKLYKNEVNW